MQTANVRLDTCPTCGYTWEHGKDGTHSCVTQLGCRIASLENKIRELEDSIDPYSLLDQSINSTL
jgi:hypothetical protein